MMIQKMNPMTKVFITGLIIGAFTGAFMIALDIKGEAFYVSS